MGEPVSDASGEIAATIAGEYRIWVRTRNWGAPWSPAETPGKFQVLIDNQPLQTLFGVEGDKWHWQDGGKVRISDKFHIALHDLTGFDGRRRMQFCLQRFEFSASREYGSALSKLRADNLAGLADPIEAGAYDLVVVGGGLAGTAAAVAAARQSLSVALIQDRPVLGGNGSSEVRVWPEGHINLKPFPRVGDIVGELVPPKPFSSANAVDAKYYDDARKLQLVQNEPNIRLFLNHRMIDCKAQDASISSVVAQHTHSGKRVRISGKLFLDATGDGVLGALAGADYELMESGNMGASNLWSVGDIVQNEPQLECLCKDLDPVSISFTKSQVEQKFPRCPWAIDMSNINFPGRKQSAGQWMDGRPPLQNLGAWFWESGFGKHPINDMEWVRDYNLRAMYGAWDTLKNVDKLYPNHRLKWSAYIAGKRESRRLLGPVILCADDFRKNTQWVDPAFPCTWHIDLHDPDPKFNDKSLDEAFISRATESQDFRYKGPYWAPYRCLYSRNIKNLFMAGRDVSCSHDGLGAIRVMRTCGMMGEAVGKAAWICVYHHCSPQDVYDQHLPVFKSLLEQPGLMRRQSVEAPLELPSGMVAPPVATVGINPATLAGIVMDDSDAKLTGNWSGTGSLVGFVGEGYQYSSDIAAKAQYDFKVPQAGSYEVRIGWQPHQNRARSARVLVYSANDEREIQIDQTQAPRGEKGMQSIGTFDFQPNKPASVEFLVIDSQGVVHIDAVALVRVKKD
ncbi:MAG: FAD-dependent oxidoreductase [Pirellulales bacterium]